MRICGASTRRRGNSGTYSQGGQGEDAAPGRGSATSSATRPSRRCRKRSSIPNGDCSGCTTSLAVVRRRWTATGPATRAPPTAASCSRPIMAGVVHRPDRTRRKPVRECLADDPRRHPAGGAPQVRRRRRRRTHSTADADHATAGLAAADRPDGERSARTSTR